VINLSIVLVYWSLSFSCLYFESTSCLVYSIIPWISAITHFLLSFTLNLTYWSVFSSIGMIKYLSSKASATMWYMTVQQWVTLTADIGDDQ
jgi:hypothetical protein